MPAGAADLSGVPSNPLSSGRAAGQVRSSGLVTDGRPTSHYDFLRPPKLAREHLRALQTVTETFAHRLAILLTSRLRIVCRVEPRPIEQVSVAEHVESLEDDVVITPMTLEPLTGVAALELSLPSVMSTIDRLLGGHGGQPQPQRPLSDIETPLLRGLIRDVLTELCFAFEDIVTLEPAFGQQEYNAQLVQYGGPTEALIIAAFDVSVAGSASVLSLCLPLQSLLPVLQRHLDQVALSPSERAARQAAKELLTARIQEVPIDVTVVFAPVRLRSDQLVDLRPGDLVPLDHPVDKPLDITTADRVFGRAVATKRGQRLACQVVAATDARDD